MNKTLATAMFACAVLGMGSTLTAAPLTLEDCVLTAVKNSPEISSQRHTVAAYQDDIIKKKATTLPFLSSQLQSYEINGKPVTPWSAAGVFEPENGAGRRDVHWAPIALESVGVSYPILFQGSFLGLNDSPVEAAARAQLTQGQIQELLAEQKIVLEVVSDFIYAAGYRRRLAILDQILERTDTEVAIVRNQVRLGRKLPQDAELLEDRRLALEEARAATEENASNFLSDLSSLISSGSGLEDPNIQIDERLPPLVKLPPIRSFLDQVVQNNPLLRIEDAKLEMSRQQLRVDEADSWPTASFNTTFAAGQDLDFLDGNGTHSRPTAFQSYLTVTIPIFDFGGRRAAIGESKESLLAQRDHVKQVERDIRLAITRTFGQILDNTTTAARLTTELQKDRARVGLLTAQMNQGDVDQMELLEAEIEALQDTLSVQANEMSQQLEYAQLQNLAAGKWHWAP